MASQDAIPKSGGESFDLVLNRLPHVARGAVWHVAISPQGVPVLGGSRWIEQALLRDQDKRPFRMFTPRNAAFAQRDFFQGTTKMQRAGGATGVGPPRYRLGERAIHLEDAGRMTKAR